MGVPRVVVLLRAAAQHSMAIVTRAAPVRAVHDQALAKDLALPRQHRLRVREIQQLLDQSSPK
jgi:hypothetical protein